MVSGGLVALLPPNRKQSKHPEQTEEEASVVSQTICDNTYAQTHVCLNVLMCAYTCVFNFFKTKSSVKEI